MPEVLTPDAAAAADTSPNPDGTPDASPEGEGTDPAVQVASARRRQAGAEAARQAAEAKAAALQAKLDAITASSGTEEAVTVATLTEKLRIAEETAASADKRVAAAILDAKYPNARAELPEVTDEVKLAKFEAMLADDPAPVAPRRPNGPQNGTAGAAPDAKPEETSADIEKRLRNMTWPT